MTPKAAVSASVARLLDRIAEIDPRIRSVCTVNPAARSEAARLDAEPSRGPLHGVPVLVKDNIDTADLPTTAGSLALVDHPPTRDAPLVRRLRDAGCVILGKTNLSEWANFRGLASSSGWSAYGGLSRNPYALNRSAGGSSSGSGAAVAAGLAPLAVGTETNGSIVCPAALNGVVGIKPTVGLIPSEGIVPISHSQDTAGPMARTVREAAALLTVLTGGATDYATQCADDGLRGARIGVPRGPSMWGHSHHLDRTTEEALRLIAKAGATVVDDLELPIPSYDDQLTVLRHELKTDLAAYLATRPGGPRTLADVIAFNREHADVELAHFGQELFEQAEETDGLDAPVYVAARLSTHQLGRDGIDRLLNEYQLDALVMPAYAPAWPIDLVNGDHVSGDSTTPSAVAGYPLVAVPAGMAAGLPVGILFAGTAGRDATLIRLAHAFEQARIDEQGPLPAPEFRAWL